MQIHHTRVTNGKRLTSINLSIVASVGRYVMRNFIFLYSISAGSGLRTFIAFIDADDVIALISGTTVTPADKIRFSCRIQRTTVTLGRHSDEQVTWRH